ncbi:hypothetical protein MCACP_15190 [Neomoorella carbonis]
MPSAINIYHDCIFGKYKFNRKRLLITLDSRRQVGAPYRGGSQMISRAYQIIRSCKKGGGFFPVAFSSVLPRQTDILTDLKIVGIYMGI